MKKLNLIYTILIIIILLHGLSLAKNYLHSNTVIMVEIVGFTPQSGVANNDDEVLVYYNVDLPLPDEFADVKIFIDDVEVYHHSTKYKGSGSFNLGKLTAGNHIIKVTNTYNGTVYTSTETININEVPETYEPEIPNLTATGLSESTIQLEWNHVEDDANSRIYHLYRSDNNTVFDHIGYTFENSYIDTDLRDGEMYYYKVRVKLNSWKTNGVGAWSDYSNTASAATWLEPSQMVYIAGITPNSNVATNYNEVTVYYNVNLPPPDYFADVKILVDDVEVYHHSSKYKGNGSFNIGKLSVGEHTIKVTNTYKGTVFEATEIINIVQAPEPYVRITRFEPASAVIYTYEQYSMRYYCDELAKSDDLFIFYDVSGPYTQNSYKVIIDGVVMQERSVSSSNTGELNTRLLNYLPDFIVGTHSVKIELNIDGVIYSDETTFVIKPATSLEYLSFEPELTRVTSDDVINFRFRFDVCPLNTYTKKNFRIIRDGENIYEFQYFNCQEYNLGVGNLSPGNHSIKMEVYGKGGWNGDSIEVYVHEAPEVIISGVLPNSGVITTADSIKLLYQLETLDLFTNSKITLDNQVIFDGEIRKGNQNYDLGSLSSGEHLVKVEHSFNDRIYSDSLLFNVELETVDIPLLTSQTISETSIKLNWNLLADATAYKLYRSINSVDYIEIADITENEYIDSNLDLTETYSYKIEAYNPSVSSGLSEPIIPLEHLLVTNLSVTPKSTNSIDLSWSNNANVDGYRLYRSLNLTDFVMIKEGLVNNYIDSNLTVNTDYYYKLEAYKNNTSSISEYKKGTTLLSTPAISISSVTVDSTIVSWGAIFGAEKYIINRSLDNLNYTAIDSVTSTTFVDKGLEPVRQYYYKVTAKNNTNHSDESIPQSIVTPVFVEAASIMGLTAISHDNVEIHWTNIADATDYRVYRSIDNINFSIIAASTSGINNYSDTGLSENTTYYYKILVINGTAESKLSIEKSIRTPSRILPVPQLSGDNLNSSDMIKIAWETVPEVDGYLLKRSLDNITYIKLDTLTAIETQFVDENLSPNTEYFYTIQAIKGESVSINSNVLSLMTLSPLPDLCFSYMFCTEISTQDSLESGDNLRVNTRIKNISNIASEAVNIKYYLSVDTLKNAGDILIKTHVLDSGINGKDSISYYGDYSTRYSVNDVPAGDYHIIAIIDDYNSISERNKNNNTMITPNKLHIYSAKPDLQIVRYYQIPDTMNASNELRITRGYYNYGMKSAGAFKIKYSLSFDQLNSIDDIILDIEEISSLDADSSFMGLKKLNIPNIPSGNYYLLLTIDCEGNIDENNEMNNVFDQDIIHINNDGVIPTAYIPNLEVENVTFSTVDLNWNDVSVATGYKLYFNTDSLDGAYEFLTDIPKNQTTYTHPELEKGSNYYYKISSMNGIFPYGTSEGVKAITLSDQMPMPANFIAKSMDETTIQLAWDDLDDETGYRIYKVNTELLENPDEQTLENPLLYELIAEVNSNLTEYTITEESDSNATAGNNSSTIYAIDAVYNYNDQINLSSEKTTTDLLFKKIWKSVEYDYNHLDMITEVNIDEGKTILDYTYNNMGLLNDVATTTGTTTISDVSYLYHQDDQLAAANINSIGLVDYTYHSTRGWLTKIIAPDGAFEEHLTYFDNGNVETQRNVQNQFNTIDNDYTYTFAYDAQNRLLSATSSEITNYNRNYLYNDDGGIGSITNETGTTELTYADGTHQLDASEGFEYDGKGNVIKDNNGLIIEELDHRNLPLKVKKGSEYSEYFYNDAGNRVNKITESSLVMGYDFKFHSIYYNNGTELLPSVGYNFIYSPKIDRVQIHGSTIKIFGKYVGTEEEVTSGVEKTIENYDDTFRLYHLSFDYKAATGLNKVSVTVIVKDSYGTEVKRNTYLVTDGTRGDWHFYSRVIMLASGHQAEVEINGHFKQDIYGYLLLDDINIEKISNYKNENYLLGANGEQLAIYENNKLKSVNITGNGAVGKITFNEDGTVDNKTYYINDHLGSVRLAHFSDGEVAFAKNFDPYGNTLQESIDSYFDPRYQFTGKERDEETNLDYFGARYYNSEIGIWYSVDPLAAKYPGWSPYNYTLGNPSNFTDPNGMDVDSQGRIIDGHYNFSEEDEEDKKKKEEVNSSITFLLPSSLTAIGLAGEIKVEQLYRDGFRMGPNGLYKLSPRNSRWFAKFPMSKGIAPSTRLTQGLKSFGRLGPFVSVGLTVMDINSYSTGEISAGRLGYRVTSTLASMYYGAQMGGGIGLAIGLSSGLAEIAFDAFQLYIIKPLAKFNSQIETSLRNGTWQPTR